MSTDLKDLGLLLDAKVPVLIIESFEEPRVLEMITRFAVKRASPLYAWSITEALNRLGFGSRPKPDEASQDATAVLEHIKQADVPGIYVLCDIHPYIDDDPINIRLLREIAMRHQTLGHTIILLSHAFALPRKIKRYSARFELSMPPCLYYGLFDLTRLAEITEGSSGAEIEQAIVSALYTVSASEESLTPQRLIETIYGTDPLSVVMQEKIQGLRLWAKERCVFAD